VVYRGGLENRFGLTPNGGSNPSPSARKTVNEYVKLGIWVLVIGAIFGYLWHKGELLRLTRYVQETREELKKCTWPTWEELKGSTLVVMISILLLGVFTVLVDYVLHLLVKAMIQI
jgi:preprotein translocase subunit SecE